MRSRSLLIYKKAFTQLGLHPPGNVTQTYNYNSARLLDDETLALDGKSFKLDYGYDNLGSLNTLIYPSSSGVGTVSFAPNAFGQTTKATRSGANYATNASYYANGILNSFTYGNGITHKTTLDTRNMPWKIKDSKGTTDRVKLTYLYDNQNNITKITDAVTPNFSLTGLSYDGLNRLTGTTSAVGSKIGNSEIIYDAIGNITSYTNTSSIKASSLSYTYNTSTNKLTGVSGNGAAGYNFNQAGSYDNRGNVTSNGMRNFIYNLANQMTNSGSNRYVYDGYNRRVKTQDSKGTSYSMYSQSGRLLYREVNGDPISYIFLGDKLIAKEGIMPASSDSRMHYKPFGDSIEQAKDEVGYTGHKFDTDLGLSYMQARYYDPVIGRFYSNDPIGYRGVHSFNRYAYVNNNPYKYVDPSGMCAEGTGKDGCTITGKTSGNISGTEIDPTSPSAVNGHAIG
ncbi:MAG: RHS repeat-associated core domain-containing protein [Methylococcales bacterium]